MVVGALITYFAPSNRGFVRVKDSTDVPFESLHNFDDLDDDDDPANIDNSNQNHHHSNSRRGSIRHGAPVTALRRKPLRAMAVLTSIASDFDIVSDWCFFRQSLSQDNEYRAEYEANPVEGELPYLVPRRLLFAVFLSCFLGSIMYLIIATEGRIVAPISRRMGIDKISMGFVLFVSILVEDVPQIILTFLVEDYYEEKQYLSQMAVLNLTASLYDTLIKLAESYDERHDVVETGIWCKKSIVGHKATITDILVLPDGTNVPPPPPPPPANLSEQQRSLSASVTANSSRRQTTSSRIDMSSMSLPSLPTVSFRKRSQKPLLVEAFFPDEESMAPRAYFLSSSLDKTVKLWRVTSTGDTQSSSSMPSSSTPSKETCVRVFRDVESGGFTCLAWVGEGGSMAGAAAGSSEKQIQQPKQSYFLTGCNKGSTKLWDLSGVCHATYQIDDSNQSNRVASIATAAIDGRHTFVCGHESGVIRLWNTWGMFCLGEIKGHDRRVTSLTFLAEGTQFVSASTDSTLKLWDTKVLVQKQKPEAGIEVEAKTNGIPAIRPGSSNSDLHLESKATNDKKISTVAAAKTEFIGHRAAVLSVVSVDQKSAILSGSQDGTARLWSIDSGVCLRIFRGHRNGVYSVLAIDRVTFLTGSSDSTIRAWDALSGECLRTYEGHKNTVTGLATVSVSKDETDGATSFISSSADKSIKCWVLTAVSYRDPAATLDQILDFHENTCRCFDAASYGYPNRSSPKGNLMNACGPDQCDFDHPYYEYQEAPL